MKETELAKIFIDFLSDYDLYFEVDYCRCVDIVGLIGSLSIAVEVKTSFNFKVLEQTIENKPYFNYSYIAVPDSKNDFFIRKLCKDYGLGLLVSCKQGKDVRLLVQPVLNRHANNKKLKERLSEKNKLSLAGCKSGDGFKITAFGLTKDNLIKYVRRHNGCLIKDAIKEISHHYSSEKAAVSNLVQWIKNGVIKELKIEDKRIYLNDLI